MKNLWFVALASTLLFSCSEKIFKPQNKKLKIHNLVKKSSNKNAEEYENQDGYFDDIFNKDGNYIGYYKVGKPYKTKGSSYTPKNYENYKETGKASWYGSDFHGKKTANGEIFNSDSVTAAHRTLPLPSMVRVTNLKNGKMIMARVNDRGPFSKDRVIDLSEKSAILLGFKSQGTAQVRVELLPDETEELLRQLNIRNK